MASYLHNRLQQKLNNKHTASIFYHDIFGYPLTKYELEKWQIGNKVRIGNSELRIRKKKGFYFLKGREGNILKRLSRQKASFKKLKIARRVAKVLAKMPTIKMVGITGALAMRNSDPESDIDLIIVASKGTLWTTRLITYFLLLVSGFKTRRPNNRDQKDKLCLNMWFDESNLVWRRRNIFTAHEIAQIIPIVNKDKTYEKLVYKNQWIFGFWPKSVEMSRQYKKLPITNYLSPFTSLFEKIAFWLQYLYMRSKITCEIVTKTRAVFHPFDWSKHIKARGFG